MKQLYLFFALAMASMSVMAQNTPCVPDETLQDSIGVFPLPFDEVTNPEGGITEIACINNPYEFVFTIVIGDTLVVSGSSIVIDSIQFSTDTALVGMPTGLTYECSTPDCKFFRDSIGCLVIKGTPDGSNSPGVYPLSITGTIFSGAIAAELTFPNELIAAGSYDIQLEEANSANCMTSSTLNIWDKSQLDLQFYPNPTTGYGTLNVEAPTTGVYQFRLFNLLGREIFYAPMQLNKGKNQMDMDFSFLADGMYLYNLSNGKSQLTKRLMVKKLRP